MNDPVTVNQGMKEVFLAMHKCLIELIGCGNAEEYHQMLKKELKLRVIANIPTTKHKGKQVKKVRNLKGI